MLTPVSRELAFLWRQVAEHELAAFDIGCSGEPNHVHPDREGAMTLGGNEPPSPVPPLSAEEAGCAKTAGLQNPAEAIAPRGIGKPLRDRARFLGTPCAQYLCRVLLLRRLTLIKLTKAVD